MNKLQISYIAILLSFTVVMIFVQVVLPYPYGLIIALGIMFVPIPLARVFARKYGVYGVSGSIGFSKIKKACLACNLVTNRRSCSRCGGKAFRMQ